MPLLEYYGSLEAALIRFAAIRMEARRIAVNDKWWNEINPAQRAKYAAICEKHRIELEPTSLVPAGRVSIWLDDYAADEYDAAHPPVVHESSILDDDDERVTEITFGSHAGD